MAKDPGIGYRVTATVIGSEGTCTAGHSVGESFDISCHNPNGLCGFFYNAIFSSLSTFQFGGSYPWWEGDTIELECPDRANLVTIQLQRSQR